MPFAQPSSPTVEGSPLTAEAVRATLRWDTETMMTLAAPVVVRFLAVCIVALVATRVVRRAIGRVDDERARQQLLFFVPKIVRVLVIVGGLEFVGIDVSGMAAVLATIGVTGAVAFTPIGQNFVAGAMITIDDLYRVGEVVTVAGIFGRVRYKSVLRTELELPDGTTAWIPNSQFQEQQVLNHSRLGGCRLSVEVPLDGTPDRAVASATMNGAIEDLSWNSAGRRPFIVFDRVGGEAMFFTAYAWIDDRTWEPYYRGLLLTTLVDALENAGFSVGQTTNLSLAASPRSAVATDVMPRVPGQPRSSTWSASEQRTPGARTGTHQQRSTAIAGRSRVSRVVRPRR